MRPKPQLTDPLQRHKSPREFVSALAEIISAPAIAEFDTRFEWAPSQREPTGIQNRVKVPASEYAKLEHTARELKKIGKRQYNVLTGPIVMVGKDPDVPLIHVAIKTVRQGRPCRVETWLRNVPLEDVLGWMNRGLTVQLEGVVVKEGHALRVREPTKFGPTHVPPTLLTSRLSCAFASVRRSAHLPGGSSLPRPGLRLRPRVRGHSLGVVVGEQVGIDAQRRRHLRVSHEALSCNGGIPAASGLSRGSCTSWAAPTTRRHCRPPWRAN